ncbi:hypothetical protein AAFP30_03700 [Gordonia sp. CPCC 205515]|uniref:hypothetical protein n=1 Tax=Gordonia sp. CPCC 205515 TaxID=3140791 RepID=UPI003AF3EB52
MLTLALAATLVGFVLLVVGLITGTVWLAVACIVICLLGLAFLIADVLGVGRRRKERTLADFVGSDAAATARPADVTVDTSADGNTIGGGDLGSLVSGDTPPHHGRHEAPDSAARVSPPASTGPISAVPADSDPHHVTEPSTSTGSLRAQDGTLDDYLRSVGGDDIPEKPAPQAQPFRPPSFDRLADDQSAASDNGVPDEPAITPHVEPADRSTTRKFDPLDPNWRPPLD